MIHVLAPGNDPALSTLLTAALGRSCGREQVVQGSYADLLAPGSADAAWVVANPLEDWAPALILLARTRRKLVLLGRLPSSLADVLGVRCETLSAELQEAAACAPAATYRVSESAAHVRWRTGAIARISGRSSPFPDRTLRRYDFTDEWNNLGFGAITTDGSVWSLAQQATLHPENELAAICSDASTFGAYAGLWNDGPGSVLWFNRAAGPVDSQEWRLLEDFLSCHRAAELPCWPVLGEVPHGYDAAVTMRLDCDEDVESARSLWQVYQREGIPFSLALHARVLADARHHRLPRDVLAGGGAILSHTATHAPDWGGSYDAAYLEGQQSAQTILDTIGCPVRYAVSPFHQTPVYARWGLADAGYQGCIGGIIRNDFDFLMARSGTPPQSGEGFIGHSQQCMLHGDCLLESGDPLAVFKAAFELARLGGAFFGYLDHPFSERYQYGWLTEAQRADAHLALIQHMRASGHVLFANEDQAMDFLLARSRTQVRATPDGFHIRQPANAPDWALQVRYKGETLRIQGEGLVR